MKQHAIRVCTDGDIKKLNDMFDEGWLVQFTCPLNPSATEMIQKKGAALVILGKEI